MELAFLFDFSALELVLLERLLFLNALPQVGVLVVRPRDDRGEFAEELHELIHALLVVSLLLEIHVEVLVIVLLAIHRTCSVWRPVIDRHVKALSIILLRGIPLHAGTSLWRRVAQGILHSPCAPLGRQQPPSSRHWHHS